MCLPELIKVGLIVSDAQNSSGVLAPGVVGHMAERVTRIRPPTEYIEAE